jgi:hypothetical protein
MKYIFPAPQLTTCAEFHAWRFQRCVICWWMGDITTGDYIIFERSYGALTVDGVLYDRGLPEYLVAIGICKDPEN